MLVSLHTPKAGGTSFRNLLEQHFKKKLQTDYDNPLNKSFEERSLQAINFDKEFRLYKRYLYIIRNIQCVHGHFLPYKYHSLVNKRNVHFITCFVILLKDLITLLFLEKIL